MLSCLKNISTLGDGLCFYHSVLQAISSEYHSGDKIKLAQELHKYVKVIYSFIRDKKHINIDSDDLVDLNRVVSSGMLDEKMLCEGKESDEAIIAFTSIVLRTNIIILNLSSHPKYAHSLLIARQRFTSFIIISLVGNNHYETTILDKQTVFPSDHKIITEIIYRLNLRNYWSIYD